MTGMKIVADTNVLISAFGWNGPEHELIARCLRTEITLCFSAQTLEEFKVVSLRKKFGFSQDEIDEFIDALLEASQMVFPEEQINEIKDDPKDNKFLECAAEAKAQFIVSGDRHLLKLGQFRRTKILSAKQFLSKNRQG